MRGVYGGPNGDVGDPRGVYGGYTGGTNGVKGGYTEGIETRDNAGARAAGTNLDYIRPPLEAV